MSDQPYTRLPLSEAFNTRELGGHPCFHGGATSWQTFLRGDNPSFLQPEDIQFLLDYGIRAVIDLRSGDELEEYPNPLRTVPGIAYHHIPFVAGNIGDVTRMLADKPEAFIQRFYILLLQEGTAGIRTAFTVMADEDAGGLLFHCTAGKDRTGVLAMLLLSVAGVPDADIISDYCISYHFNMGNPRVRKLAEYASREVLASHPEYILAAMDYLDTRYPSREAYLNSIGVSSEMITHIRKRFCGCPRI